MIYNLLSILVFTIFLYIVYKKGKNSPQSSISKGYYLFDSNTGKILYYFFYLAFCWLLFISDPSGIMFGACAAISFVGVALDYKSGGTELKVHMIGAGGGIGLAMLSLIVDDKLWWYAVPLTVLAIYVSKKGGKNKTWWAEIISFYGVAFGKLLSLMI